jgi:predicted nicotinamide N-methyase
MDDSAFLIGSFEDIAPIRPVEHLGEADLTFDGRLESPLKIWEDGGAVGCGGKIWIAGELLSKYLLDKKICQRGKIIEIGSGTGLVGLSLGLSIPDNNDAEIWITDIDELVPLMEKNIELNELKGTVHAAALSWGEPLPDYAKNHVDVILAADCVYLEKAFPLLEKTLLDLTTEDTFVLMSYRKRRKADSKFFRKIRKNFDIVQITDFKDYDAYIKQSVNLFQLVRRVKKKEATA